MKSIFIYFAVNVMSVCPCIVDDMKIENQLYATQWFIELMIRSTPNLQSRTSPMTSCNQGYVPHAVIICIVSSS